MAEPAKKRRLGGREMTSAQVDGAYAISVGKSKKPLPAGWKWTLLTDVARLESGHTPSRRRPEYWGGDIPWIGIRDATGNHGRTIQATNECTNELGIANSAARVLPKDTVCLSRTASVGYVVVMGRPMATSQDFVNWICSDQLDYRFLKYALIAEGKELLKFADGSVHQTIYFPEVKAFHIALPPLSEQKRIAEVLSAFDDKIELNRRMNETLERMAHAIFRDWFVDFGPVRRKLDGATDPVKIMGGVTTDTDEAARLAALFPATLAENGLPEGWEERPLTDFLTLVGGGTPKTSIDEYWNGTIPWFSVVDTPPAGGVFALKTEKNISDRGLAESSARLVQKGTTIISARGTVGNLAIAPAEMTFNQSCYGLRAKEPAGDYLVYLAAQRAVDLLRSMAHGSVFSTITRQTFDGITLADAGQLILQAFESRVDPLFEKILATGRESETLAAMRDLLLPKLMSGEIRLKDAEKIAEAAE
jgi:type I restriction enzyme S subunit